MNYNDLQARNILGTKLGIGEYSADKRPGEGC